jgi:hypothetical protein
MVSTRRALALGSLSLLLLGLVLGVKAAAQPVT